MTTLAACPCNPEKTYQQCCQRYHNGAIPSTAPALMRARYSAYVLHNIAFIKNTSLPAQQAHLDTDTIAQWSQNSQWLGLEIKQTSLASDQRHATVEFIAHWQDAQGQHQHRESSLFIKLDTHWYFYDPNAPLRAERNALCPCGSTLKFKKCCAPYL